MREPTKGPRKKQRSQRPEHDEVVTLTKGDLEKIADVVTLATEEKWLALEEQQKAAVNTL